MTSKPIVLNSFALSHYCETARWALDYKGVPYTEKSWAPLLHLLRTWRLPKTYTPIIRVDGEAIQESGDICAYLERRFPNPPLIPESHRKAVLHEAERARTIGPHVRRLAYFALGDDPARLEEGWRMNLSGGELGLQRIVFQMSRRMVFKVFQVNEDGVAESEAAVRAFLDQTSQRLPPEQEYLVADRFTLADLTLAAMLSPLVRPPEHPFYPRMRPGKGSDRLMRAFEGHPALAYVRRTYAEHRRRNASVGARANPCSPASASSNHEADSPP